MEIAIVGIGTANPQFKYRQEEIFQSIGSTLKLSAKEKLLQRAIYKSSGIQYRYSVLSLEDNMKNIFSSTKQRMQIYKNQAFNLATSAIENCLNGFDKSAVTHLITVSCTGMYAPGIDIEIIQKLGLNPHIERTAINFMGCYGAFNAIKVAHAICQSKPDAKIIVVCVEICTLHFQAENNMDSMISNALFSDGAGAMLIQAQPNTTKHFTFTHFHCDLLPQTNQEMAWNISDHGFDIILSQYVPSMIESGIANFVSNLLKKSNHFLNDTAFYAIHPGGKKILEACEKALNLSKEDNKYSYQVLNEYGNMSSATVIFVLKKIWDTMTDSDDAKKIFSCAFGPGLTLEAMLLSTVYRGEK